MASMEQFIIENTPIETRRGAQLLLLLITTIFFTTSLVVMYTKVIDRKIPTPIEIQKEIRLRTQQ